MNTDRPLTFIFVDREYGGGIWNVIDPVAESLLEAGHRVVYCLTTMRGKRSNQRPPRGIEVVELTLKDVRISAIRPLAEMFEFARQFRRVVKTVSPDIVHTNFAMPAIPARAVARAEGVPIIVSTQHELWRSMSAHLRWGLRITAGLVDARVCVSRAVARSFGVDSPLEADTSNAAQGCIDVLIYNGIPRDWPPPSLTSCAEKLSDAPRLVCVGRLAKVKGQDALIRALPKILAKHPHVTCEFIGEGPELTRLQRLVDSLNLQNSVEFAGSLSRFDVARAYRDATLAIVPSDGTQEGFGLVAAEAMAAGTPLVISDIPVFREICEGPDHAWFFAPGNPAELAEVVLNALADPAERNRRAAAARRHVRKHFSEEEMTRRYLALYASLSGVPMNPKKRLAS